MIAISPLATNELKLSSISWIVVSRKVMFNKRSNTMIYPTYFLKLNVLAVQLYNTDRKLCRNFNFVKIEMRFN